MNIIISDIDFTRNWRSSRKTVIEQVKKLICCKQRQCRIQNDNKETE